jgi:glycine/D-amino acid oxidase-like deaminating enzyme
MKTVDVVIVGAGVYGLMLALSLRSAGRSVLILEKTTPGNPQAGSSGVTRVGHSMYDDPEYIQLATRSLQRYRSFFREGLVDCLAIDFACEECNTERNNIYCARVLHHGQPHHVPFGATDIAGTYSQFVGKLYGCADVGGGIFKLSFIRGKLLKELASSGVACISHAEITSISEVERGIEVQYNESEVIRAQHVVIAAGYSSQSVVDTIFGVSRLDLGIQPTAPGSPLYFKPRTDAQFRAVCHEVLPAFSFIEHGIFGIPLIEGYTDSVKIAGFYDPKSQLKLGLDPLEFLERHLPFLLDFEITQPVVSDQCLYDYTSDGHFIVGAMPESPNIFIACGWNGGGYKFAPAITELLAELMLSGVNKIPRVMAPERLRRA